ncbi:MAG: SMR family transporter [Solirubrobacterales bacterium]
MIYLVLAGAVVFEVVGTMSLRASEGGRKKVWLIPVAVGYLLAFTLLSLTLADGVPLGVAYGIWAACGVGLTALLGRLIFKEPFTLVMGLGIGLIGVGVLLIEAGGTH